MSESSTKVVRDLKVQADTLAVIGRFYPNWQTDPKEAAAAIRMLDRVSRELQADWDRAHA